MNVSTCCFPCLYFKVFTCSILFLVAVNVAVFLVEKVPRLLTLEYGKDTTAGLILKMMVENLAMPSKAKDVFCIWLVSPLLRTLTNVLLGSYQE